jgi:hypothetical protein
MLIGISGYIGSGKDTFADMLRHCIYQILCKKENKHSFTYDLWAKVKTEGIKSNQSGWEIRKFADPLKEIMCILIGCTREQLEDREFKESDLGKEWMLKRHTWAHRDGIIEAMKHSSTDYKDEADWSEQNGYRYIRGNFVKEYITVRTVREALQTVGTDLFREKFHPNTWVNALMNRYQPVMIPGGSHYEGESIFAGMLPSTERWPNWIITDVRFPNEAEVIKEKNGILIRVYRPNGLTSKHKSETALDDYKFDVVIDNSGDLDRLYAQAQDTVVNYKLHDTNDNPTALRS